MPLSDAISVFLTLYEHLEILHIVCDTFQLAFKESSFSPMHAVVGTCTARSLFYS